MVSIGHLSQTEICPGASLGVGLTNSWMIRLCCTKILKLVEILVGKAAALAVVELKAYHGEYHTLEFVLKSIGMVEDFVLKSI